ncbi:cupin domain-containing protein [Dyadobacter sandarakinus]|uniref:Cupin domain-containing protein n=1 Tax=Dyadobacter sandarakinus TaxID=2747268 RepID=A0ABX7I7B6_9BACT|nr:cupin domain-containing protein [Dyadobacter sandarakinus]QRR01377.1 cupin domain-containing protein [Dyadobacter sandarakinus]
MKTITNTNTPERAARTITNPLIKDEVVFLETSRETGGKHTLVEVTLAGGAGNPLHYHDHFSEEFTCLSGQLSIELNGKVIVLSPGETAVAPIGSKHRFFNQSESPCRFQCRIAPGCAGFEQTLQITYGLAREGKTNKQGMPQSPVILGYMFLISGTRLTGILSGIEPLLRWLGRRAISKGIAADLQRRYITIH